MTFYRLEDVVEYSALSFGPHIEVDGDYEDSCSSPLPVSDEKTEDEETKR